MSVYNKRKDRRAFGTYSERERLGQESVPFLLTSSDARIFFQESQGFLPIFDDPMGLLGGSDGSDGGVGGCGAMIMVMVMVSGKDRRSGADDYSAFL